MDGRGGGGAIRHVDRNARACERPRRRPETPQVIEIRLHELARRHRDVIASGRMPARVGHHRFDRALARFAELFAAARKHLDAVVGIRVVGRRQHDAEIVVQRPREKRDARRRQHACVGHGGAFSRGPARELARDPLPRFPRVPADDEARGPFQTKRPHNGRAEPADGRRIQWIRTGHTAHAVGAEQSLSHPRVRSI